MDPPSLTVTCLCSQFRVAASIVLTTVNNKRCHAQRCTRRCHVQMHRKKPRGGSSLQVGLRSWGKPVGIVAGEVVGHAPLAHADLLGGGRPVGMLAQKKREGLRKEVIILGSIVHCCHHVAQHGRLTAWQAWKLRVAGGIIGRGVLVGVVDSGVKSRFIGSKAHDADVGARQQMF